MSSIKWFSRIGGRGQSVNSPQGVGRILSNFTHLLSGKIGAGLFSLVYLVVAAHRLGVHDYGVLTLINSYALLVGGVVAFSGFHGVVRYGAQALEAGDRAMLGKVVRVMAALELGCGAAAILVALLGVRLVGPRLGWPPVAVELGGVYALAVIGTVRQTPQAVLQLAGRFDLIALHSLVQPIIRLLGAVALWFGGGGLPGFILVWLASSIGEGAAMWLLALPAWARLAPGERLLGRWRGGPATPAGFAGFVLATNFDLTLRDLAPNLAPLTVGWLLGPTAAGLLAVAQRATNALQQPAMLLSQASYAVLAEQLARGAVAEVRQTVTRSAWLAFAAGSAAAIALAIFARPLLSAVGGRGFEAARGLVPPIAAARAIALSVVAPTAGLIAAGRPQQSALASMTANLFLYPVLPVLIRIYGVQGAAFQQLLQSGVLAIMVTLFLKQAFARASVQGARPGESRDPDSPVG